VDQTKYDSSTAQDPGAVQSSSPVDESPRPSSPSQISGAVPSASNANSPEALESKHSPSPIDLALPDGITLPKSVDPNFFSQNRLRTSFNELSSSQMTAALEEYDIAMRSKGETVRNPQAYFFGVIKRYLNLQKNNGKDSSDNNSPMGENLSTPVKERLDDLIARNICSTSDLNGNVMDKMKLLSSEDAILAIDEISDVNPESIRNFPSYFIGILNRHTRGEISRQKKKDKVGGHRDDRERERSRSRRDKERRERSRDERDEGRRARERSHRRSPERRHRRRRDSRERSRSHSRDRYDSYSSDEDFERRERRRRRRDRSRSKSRSRSRSRSRGRYDRERDDDYDERRHRRSRDEEYVERKSSSRRGHERDFRRDRNEKDSHRRRSHRDGSPYSGRSEGMSGMPGHYNGPPMGMPHGYSVPPPPMQQAPNMHFSPAPPPGYVNGPPPPYGQGQQHSSNGYSHSSGPMPPSQSGSYQQHMSGGSGGSNSNYMMSSQGQQQSNSSYSGSSWQAPPDILGLAEQAKQAMQHINQPHGHKDGPSQSHSGELTVSSLPVMVQYAIKNLEATGYLDRELTGTCLRILSKLPEPVALQSLEKFSSCDTSIMRNKEAYLAGILKKAINS